MKHLFLILFSVIISFGLMAQTVEIPKLKKQKTISDKTIYIGCYPSSPLGVADEYGYTTTTVPAYLDVSIIDSLWEANSMKNITYSENLDTLFMPSRTKYYTALKNRYGVAINQNVKIKINIDKEMSNPKQFWYLYEDSQKKGKPIKDYYKEKQVDELINPITVIDTSVVDVTSF